MLSSLPQNAPFTKNEWMIVLEMAKQDVIDQVWFTDDRKRFPYAYISCFNCTSNGNLGWWSLVDTMLGQEGVDWDKGIYYGVTGWIHSDIDTHSVYDRATNLDNLQLPAFAKLPDFCSYYAVLYTDHTYDELQVKEKLMTGDLQFTPSLCKILHSPDFALGQK